MRQSLILTAAAMAMAACSSSPVKVPKQERDIETPLVKAERAGASASLWNQDPESLFGNRRAREVGDILTVLVAIDDEAQMLNDTLRNRTSDRVLDVPAAFSLPERIEDFVPSTSPALQMQTADRMRGQGNYRRQDRITMRLAARVVDRLPNGDLVIDGSQAVQIGADQRELAVSGVVRPEDISRQNTVPHDRIAEADIRLIGKGPLQGTSRRGLGNKLLSIVTPF
ncbi:MAG: flagellar basal body L-ring protein FlgH [Parvularculaceae bacterium]|nr:flagellar basal body L-ring protein FlgH [Parvularculaceae bacterium]